MICAFAVGAALGLAFESNFVVVILGSGAFFLISKFVEQRRLRLVDTYKAMLIFAAGCFVSHFSNMSQFYGLMSRPWGSYSGFQEAFMVYGADQTALTVVSCIVDKFFYPFSVFVAVCLWSSRKKLTLLVGRRFYLTSVFGFGIFMLPAIGLSLDYRIRLIEKIKDPIYWSFIGLMAVGVIFCIWSVRELARSKSSAFDFSKLSLRSIRMQGADAKRLARYLACLIAVLCAISLVDFCLVKYLFEGDNFRWYYGLIGSNPLAWIAYDSIRNTVGIMKMLLVATLVAIRNSLPRNMIAEPSFLSVICQRQVVGLVSLSMAIAFLVPLSLGRFISGIAGEYPRQFLPLIFFVFIYVTSRSFSGRAATASSLCLDNSGDK